MIKLWHRHRFMCEYILCARLLLSFFSVIFTVRRKCFMQWSPRAANDKVGVFRAGFFGCKNKNARAFGFTFCTTNVRDLLVSSKNWTIKWNWLTMMAPIMMATIKIPLEIAGTANFCRVCVCVDVRLVCLPITKTVAVRIEPLASCNACKAIRIVSVSYS